MTKLLKQKGSETIYVWTPILAQRDDMEPYEPEIPQLISAPEPEVFQVVDDQEPQKISPEMVEALFKRKRNKQ